MKKWARFSCFVFLLLFHKNNRFVFRFFTFVTKKIVSCFVFLLLLHKKLGLLGFMRSFKHGFADCLIFMLPVFKCMLHTRHTLRAHPKNDDKSSTILPLLGIFLLSPESIRLYSAIEQHHQWKLFEMAALLHPCFTAEWLLRNALTLVGADVVVNDYGQELPSEAVRYRDANCWSTVQGTLSLNYLNLIQVYFHWFYLY